MGCSPAAADAARRTTDLLLVPVHLELARGQALPLAGLAMIVAPCRTHQRDTMSAFAGHQQVGRHVAGVDEMGCRTKVLGREGKVDRSRHVSVRHRRRRGLDVGDQVRRVGIARFRDVDLVADPGRASLLRVAGFPVVG